MVAIRSYTTPRDTIRVALGIDDVKRTDLAIKGAAGKRLTYQTTRKQPPAPPPIGRAQLETWE